VIIRIATEGQYELDPGDEPALNQLDNAAVAASESGDAAAFYEVYGRLLAFLREHGRPVDDDHLGGSDLILPPPDVSFEEAREEFTGEGLLPG
jgi:hypothetical protein